MMFSKTNKKLLLMLSVFLCLACVVGSVSATDVNNNNVTDDSDYDNVTVVPLNHTEDCYFPAPKSAFIDYKHLPVGTIIEIKYNHDALFNYDFNIDNCYGVKLINHYTINGGHTDGMVFEVTNETYNILIYIKIHTLIGTKGVKYDFNKDPFMYGANVTVEKPVNTCLACSNVQDELIGSDVIQMDSLSVVDDAVKQPVNTCLSCFNVPTTSIGVPVNPVPQFPDEKLLLFLLIDTAGHGVGSTVCEFCIIKIVNFFKHIF